MTISPDNNTGFSLMDVISDVTHGTVAAGKAVIPTTNGVIDALDVTALKIGGVSATTGTVGVAGITATGAEINKLGGVTAGTTTASKALVVGTNKELDVLALAVSGLKIGAGAGTAMDCTAAELNKNAGVTAGTSTASKTAVLGANKNLDILALPVSGLKIGAGAGTAVDATAAELNLSNTAVAGTAVASKMLALGANKNVDTLVIADGGLFLGAGAGTSVSATAAELNLNHTAAAGTSVASKTAVLGASKNLDILGLPVSGLKVGAAGAETAVDCTAAEFNKLNGVTAGTGLASKAVILGANLDVTGLRKPPSLAHASATMSAAESGVPLVMVVDGVLTLPAASGTTTGYVAIVSCGVASGGTGVAISPNASDHIRGAGLTSVDNKDLINTGATDAIGDTATLICDGVDGWIIQSLSGIWAKE